MEQIQVIAYELHDKLLQSDEYLYLKKVESQMLKDNISVSLINKYKNLQEKYNFDKSSEVLKSLHDAKLEMDSNELVKEYKMAYKAYQLLIGKITDIVFEDFSSITLIDKIIRAK